MSEDTSSVSVVIPTIIDAYSKRTKEILYSGASPQSDSSQWMN
ncbi:MAG: hypothetical protein ACLFVP_02795 [Candidatus Bathyarchaeia archaeon]